FSLSETLEEVRALYFPGIRSDVEVRMSAHGPLAYIEHDFMGPERHLVVFHPVLNHPGTPPDVMRFIAKHELTHLVRRPRIIDGWYETHPPEFWEHEVAIGPERFAVWHWLRQNLKGYARRGRWGYFVSRRWHDIAHVPRTPYALELPLGEPRK